MPRYLTRACIDYRFAVRPLGERRALVRQLVVDVTDHTEATLLEAVADASRDAPSLPIDVAFAVEDEHPHLLIVAAGNVSEIADGAAHAARLAELWATTTEDLLPEDLLEERAQLELPASVHAALEAHREAGGTISALLAERWARAKPRVEALDARALGAALAPLAKEPKASLVAILAPWDKLDLAEEAARLGVDVSALLCFACVDGAA